MEKDHINLRERKRFHSSTEEIQKKAKTNNAPSPHWTSSLTFLPINFVLYNFYLNQSPSKARVLFTTVSPKLITVIWHVINSWEPGSKGQRNQLVRPFSNWRRWHGRERWRQEASVMREVITYSLWQVLVLVLPRVGMWKIWTQILAELFILIKHIQMCNPGGDGY